MSFNDAITTILPGAKGETVKKTGDFNEYRPKKNRRHKGVDLSYSRGSVGVISTSPPLFSPVNGTVVRIGPKSGQHEITIKDSGRTLGGKPIFHRFLHNDSVAVREGQSVSVGQKIGYVGRRGAGITQYHVHYEVRVGGTGGLTGSTIDPVAFWDGQKQEHLPNIPKEELRDTREEDPEAFTTEAGAPKIPETPQRAEELFPPKQPTGKIDDYKPRQAAVAAYSDAQVAVWTNRVPQHEPWPRVMSVDTEHINAPTTEHERNTRHNPQYSEDHRDVGRVEGDGSTERGPFWRR